MRKIITISAVSLLLVVSFILVFSVGCAIGTEKLSDEDLSLKVVEEVWNLIFSDYVDRDELDTAALGEGAIEGMLDALDDPYSSYMDPESFELSWSGIEGKFQGIGAYVSMKDDKITIIAPITGSPADKAGIRAGDIILGIDGDSTEDMTLNEAVLRIRGPEGTTVRILVLHLDETEPEELEIVRAEIEISSVYLEMMDDIAYIYISNFTERTDEELEPVLDSISREAATGIILDLRSNPGGLLTSVVDVTSRFIQKGVVLYAEDNRGNTESFKVKENVRKTELPMVVLTDNYTASASEVLSGALQDYNRAVIAGTVTYGKGSVNTLYTLQDGSGVYITTHRWLTPNGKLIEGKGITPDYELKEEDAIEWALDYLKNN
jgi:carboxyl-terminal processing protease